MLTGKFMKVLCFHSSDTETWNFVLMQKHSVASYIKQGRGFCAAVEDMKIADQWSEGSGSRQWFSSGSWTPRNFSYVPPSALLYQPWLPIVFSPYPSIALLLSNVSCMEKDNASNWSWNVSLFLEALSDNDILVDIAGLCNMYLSQLELL